MKNTKSIKTHQDNTVRIPTEITELNAPNPPKRAPKFVVQGDSNRLRY